VFSLLKKCEHQTSLTVEALPNFQKKTARFSEKISKFTPKICVLAEEIHENSHPNMSQKSARFLWKNLPNFC